MRHNRYHDECPASASPVAPTRDATTFYSTIHGTHRNVVASLVGATGEAAVIRVLLLCCLALILSGFVLLASSSPAHAQTVAGGNGRIYGQLFDGTKNNAPLAGQTVTLQVAQGGSSQDLAKAQTDAHGNYNFPNLATDKTDNYAVYMRYQGAQYVSAIVTLDTKPVQQVNLTVYEATSSTSKVATVDATILMHAPDTQKGIITVSEFFDFSNLDRSTYVGSLDASKGKPNALLFSLPQHAQNIVLGQGFSGYNVIQVGPGFASDAALLPGESQFSFSFDIPYSATSYDFSYTAYYPTVSISVLVPPDLQAHSSLLSSQGLITADQHPYRLFKTTGLLANQGFRVSLSGLPIPATAQPPTPLNTTFLWLIVGLLLMCAIIFITAFLSRLQQRQGAGRGHVAAHGKKASGHSKATKGERAEKAGISARGREEALLHELLELDKAYEKGKLPKAEYQSKRAKLKARLRAIMSEEEAARK